MQTLPARYYTDPKVFRQEIESFYAQMWVCAGRADTIPKPGDYFVREIAGENIIILRDFTGAIRAFFDVCRHRGTRMCDASEGNFGGRIMCPYHNWTYGLDGRLLGAPHMDGVGFLRENYSLNHVQVGLWDGHIFIHLGENPRQP